MNVVFADDSLAFDGYSPSSQPLDGPAKAFASLPTSLAMRGHQVTVINRCTFPVVVNGARWVTWDGERPASADVVIALHQPQLLDIVPAARRMLWIAGGATASLDTPEARAALLRHQPLIVFSTRHQNEQWANPLDLKTAVIEPGLVPSYLEDDAMAPAEPPRAICTAHPLAGVDRLLTVWTQRIRPAVSNAELRLYSATLDKGQLGATVTDALAPVLRQAQAAREQGVTILRPQADPQMAEAYRAARVHLHPGSKGDSYGFTLAESQAVGLPVVLGAASSPLCDRFIDSETGVAAASDDSFAKGAIALLTDRGMFDRMCATARLLKRGRTWAIASADWEERFT